MISLPNITFATQIHQGARTIVFRGTWEERDLPVILKTTHDDTPKLQHYARWNHEHALLSRLDCPGTPKAYALVASHSRPVLVLEDIGGTSLGTFLKERRFDLVEFLQIAVQMVEALAVIHRHGIIHKDLNPSNVVLNLASGRLQIIDFGISSLLSRETPAASHVSRLEGTLAYISPEQTGRMNRVIDYRTDFYSLGATFYEMLTGAPPFPAADRMELVHAHIARPPVAPHELVPAVPLPLSRIVTKLLAKTAEERYQTAAGLLADLERCRQSLLAGGTVHDFTLAVQDVPDRLQIPQQLYGRKTEIETLLEAFARVSRGANELLLVAGYSGIGKTALVHEIHRPILVQRGHFAAGKFDQYQKDVPYYALIQAFADLVRQLLSEGKEEIEGWRERLLAALGANGRVITDVIPEVERIIGPQPAVLELLPTEAENRFHFVFRNFVRVFADPAHPLALFLDDLQWADLPTLRLLELLATDADMAALLVIGAYRDNQVGAGHPLLLAIDALEKKGAVVRRISLQALTSDDLTQMLADTFSCERDRAAELARVLGEKTSGNPFFLIQLLASLYEQGAIALDPAAGAWRWDLARIQRAGITDNAADLMAARIKTLPPRTQSVLQMAACIGNRFDLQTLAIVSEQPLVQVSDDLWPALRESLILPGGEAYRAVEGLKLRRDLGAPGEGDALPEVAYSFMHDQIQQAAYSLIDQAEKAAAHLAIGRLLLANIPDAEQEERIFDIVNQLNVGIDLVRDAAERDALARLNLAAGKKARAAAAYGPALSHLATGIGLLPADGWQSCYDLALELHLEAAEAAFLATDYAAMERYCELVLAHAATLLDKVRAYEVKIEALAGRHEMLAAVQTGLEVLALLDVRFPEQPTQEHVVADLVATKTLLAGKSVEELRALSLMADPEKLAVMRILYRVMAPIYLSAPQYLPLAVFRQVMLSVQHGNAPTSPYAYSTYGMILCGVVGDLDEGYQFGTLALDLLEQFQDKRYKCRVYHIAYTFTRPWKEHARGTLQPLLEAYQSGLETGDFEYAAFAGLLHCYYSYFVGRELPELERVLAALDHSVQQLKQDTSHRYFQIWHQAVLNLLGRAEDPTVLVGTAYDERELLPRHLEGNDRTGLFFIYYNKMLLEFLFGQADRAATTSRLAEQYLDGVIAVMCVALYRFYDSLICLARVGQDPEASEQLLERVAANQALLKNWADHAPMNYQHQYLLVEAERARVDGREDAAIRLYNEAIELARANAYLHEEALACELAAEYFQAAGLERLAATYVRDAHLCYGRWGAAAKVQDLEARFPGVLSRQAARVATSLQDTTSTEGTSESSMEGLDLASILKASQAISSEIVLERLLASLLDIALENAGAQRGFLLLQEPGGLRIAAGRAVDGAAAALDEPVALDATDADGLPLLPVAIVNYVAHSQEPLLLGDAARTEQFVADPYVLAREPKSVLCMPVLYQGGLFGIFYLENNLTPDAFTAQRLAVLRLLSSQAAISISNARLYRNLEQANREVLQKEAQLRQFLEAVPVGVFVLDGQGTAFYANDTAKRLLGKGVVPGTSTGQLAEVYQAYVAGSGEPYPTEQMPIVQALAGQRASTDNIEIRRDGQRIQLDVSATPILDEAGQVQYAIAAFLDVTERKRAQELLRDYSRTLEQAVQERTHDAELAQQAAEAANKAKTTFLASMSHEIRTPMNAILGYAQILQRNQALESGVRDSIHAIEASGRHLLDLINEILDLSKIEAGRMELHNDDFDLGGLVRDVGRMFADRCKEKHLGWRLHYQPPANGNAVVHGDEPKLRQILINLLGNALKFTEVGEIRLRVTQASDHVYHFEVEDTGVGIAEDERALIFEPFRQGRAGTGGQGTGLGLAITLKQLELMGGTLAFDSEPGKGSRFVATVPLQSAQRAAQELRAVGTRENVRLAAGQSPLALVVDDVQNNRDVLSRVLTDIGCRVLEAANGLAAIEMVRERRPDIVWMDIRMPVLDGMEAARRIWQEFGTSAPKIVAVSASALEHEQSVYVEAGFDAFVSKPFLVQDVYECLADLLGLEFRAELPAAAATREVVHLPRPLMADLNAAIEIGNIGSIRKLLDEVRAHGEPGARLAAQLERLAASFDTDGMIGLLEQVRNE